MKALLLLSLILAPLLSSTSHAAAHGDQHHCISDDVQSAVDASGGGGTVNTSAFLADASWMQKGAPIVPAAAQRAVPISLRDTASWAPIRISTFTPDLNNEGSYCTAAGQTRFDFRSGYLTCTNDDILTEEKRRILLTKILPAAANMHKARLMVQPLMNIRVISENMARLAICKYFSIPDSHTTTGVSNTDYILYVSAAPTEETVIGWAAACLVEGGLGRPAVGVANISPRYITDTDSTIRAVAHEMMHALGFVYRYFSSTTNMVLPFGTIRGKSGSFLAIRSANVMERVRQQYGCDALRGFELEDTGGSSTARSHWKMRNAKDELMSPNLAAAIYSAISIAAMEDMGFYKGIYENAEPMAWGKDGGCDFFANKCVENGATAFPQEFCVERNADVVMCASDRKGVGSCILGDVSSFNTGVTSLPSWAQYFGSATYGSPLVAMDYCPIVVTKTNGYCASGSTAAMPGSVVSKAARCLAVADAGTTVRFGDHSVKGLCVDVKCDASARTYQVRFRGANAFVACPVGGTVTPAGGVGSAGFDRNSDGTPVACPPYDTVCSDNTEYVFGSATSENTADGLEDNNGDGASRPLPHGFPTTLLLLALLAILFSL